MMVEDAEDNLIIRLSSASSTIIATFQLILKFLYFKPFNS